MSKRRCILCLWRSHLSFCKYPRWPLESRQDYLSGRAVAARKVIRRLKNGEFVAIAPEGHTELDHSISPTYTFHSGSGALMQYAAKSGIPTIPVAIWGRPDDIRVHIGESFYPNGTSDAERVIDAMRMISLMLPEANRGPFSKKY